MRVLKWAGVVLGALVVAVLQLTVGDELTVAGVHPELLWVLPVAAGLGAGSTAGMATGFIAGAVGDLFVPAPFGLSALVGVLVGYATGVLGDEGVGDLGGTALYVAPVIAAAAGFVAPVLYACLGVVGGHESYVSAWLLVVAALDAGACALLVRPTMRVLGPLLSAGASRAGALEPIRGMM